jgi:hypothetical protein
MKLTNKNYYGTASNKQFMSVSQFKQFQKCEAMAMAELNGEYERPQSKALLLGSFVDEMLTGTKKSQIQFVCDNFSELFQKGSKLSKLDDAGRVAVITDYFTDVFNADNKPYAEIVQALETIERIKKQPLMMKHFKSKHQVIMTGEIAGVPFKIKMDNYKPDEFIADCKYMASLRSPNLFEPMVKYWGYDIQGAVYQEIVYQNTGKRLPFYLDIATKETPAHLAVAEIKQYDLDEALEKVVVFAPRYQAIKCGEIEPERCGEYDCNYCTETNVITEPIDSNLLGMSPRQVKAANGDFI